MVITSYGCRLVHWCVNGLNRLFSLFLYILEESDIDKDGTVNLSEFQHVISRSPDFVR